MLTCAISGVLILMVAELYVTPGALLGLSVPIGFIVVLPMVFAFLKIDEIF